MTDRPPTPGLRIEVIIEPANREQGEIARIQTKLTQYAADARQSSPADISQAGIDATHINDLLEADERRRAYLTRLATAPEGSHDLLVDLGNMSNASLDHVALDADYEAMTEDILRNVNHIVMQGVKPIKAVFSMSQAFAIVLGYALRANMPFPVAQAMITQVMKSATKNEQMLRIITTQ